MNIIDRIKRVMAEAGIPPRQIKPAIAHVCGVSYQAVNQWFSGEVANIRIEHLVAIARHLDVSLDWLITGEAAASSKLDPLELAGDDYEVISKYSLGRYRGGEALDSHLKLEEGLLFKKAWLRELDVNTAGILTIGVDDSSMEPYICKGDVTLIDITDTAPSSGSVYALKRPDPDNGISIRRLVRNFSGGWVIKGDNDDKRLFPDEQIGELPVIIGRVIWRGGAIR